MQADAAALLTAKSDMLPRIQDAGLDPNLLPGCTVKNWQALEDVLDSHLPKNAGEY